MIKLPSRISFKRKRTGLFAMLISRLRTSQDLTTLLTFEDVGEYWTAIPSNLAYVLRKQTNLNIRAIRKSGKPFLAILPE